ncbi:MAG: TSUP family transporter, partial [Paracoccaceae bacterium]
MTIDITFLLISIPAVIFAGISKGGFGSGAAFASTVFLALILQPGVAVGLMLPLLLLMDFGALRPYWRKWDWGAARVLVWGSVPGIGLGALFFRAANPDAIRLLIGFVAVAFVVYQGAKARGWLPAAKRQISDRAGYL